MARTADEFLARRPELLGEDRTSPRVVRAVAAATAPFAAWFRFRVSGFERVPDGPCLIVANHNSAAIFEVLLLLRAWRRAKGDRPVRGLAHRIAWHFPLRWIPIPQKIGGVFAHPDVARAALARGCALLVFPGGDVEATRPFGDRYRVTFDGRAGFARIAREARVPIVPLAICGAHAAYIMLPGARAFARLSGARALLGLKAFPLSLGFVLDVAALAAALASPSLWPLFGAAFVLSALPLPTRIEAELLDPILVRDDEPDEAAASRVERALQEALDRMAARRRTPWG